MPRRKEQTTALPASTVAFDETIRFEDRRPFVITRWIELYGVELQSQFGVLQLYKFPDSHDIDHDLGLIERFKKDPTFGHLAAFDVTRIHIKGKTHGLLFSPTHPYPRQELLLRRHYIPRQDFGVLHDFLRRIPKPLMFEGKALTPRSLYYNPNHTPQESGFYLGALSSGHHPAPIAYIKDVDRIFKRLPAGYCST